MAERLTKGGDEPRVAISWLVTGEMDITTTAWIGVIRFSQVDVHVLPKLVGGPLRVLRMLEYAAGVSLIKRLPVDRPLPANGTDLVDLLCLLLAEEAKALLRDGLLRDYRPVEDSLDVVRGRLRHRDQFLRRYGQLHTLECRFDEYDADIPENQLLALGLDVARRRVQDVTVRKEVSHLVSLLDGACAPVVRDVDWYDRTIQYGRRNERYRPVHELAKLLLRGAAFEDMFDTSSNRVTAFMIDMNVVFERFVSRLVEDSLSATGLRCLRQSPLRAVIRDDQTGRPYSTIKPDLVIEETATGRSVPIDIKYKLYGDKKLSTGDIYQLFVYGYALSRDDVVPRAGVLYAADSATEAPTLSVRGSSGAIGAKILGAGIDVPATLDALASDDRPRLESQVETMVRRLTGFIVDATLPPALPSGTHAQPRGTVSNLA